MAQIIREKNFDQKLSEIASNFIRLDDIDNCIDWALNRDYTQFSFEVENGFYIWVMDEPLVEDIPQLKILFKADGDDVYLLDVDIV